eukprot:1727755-Lingulodinium_polyedra.AAC.1
MSRDLCRYTEGCSTLCVNPNLFKAPRTSCCQIWGASRVPYSALSSTPTFDPPECGSARGNSM